MLARLLLGLILIRVSLLHLQTVADGMSRAIEEHFPVLMGDETRLLQILSNLISNASNPFWPGLNGTHPSESSLLHTIRPPPGGTLSLLPH